jgi:hypothetical protein
MLNVEGLVTLREIKSWVCKKALLQVTRDPVWFYDHTVGGENDSDTFFMTPLRKRKYTAAFTSGVRRQKKNETKLTMGPVLWAEQCLRGSLQETEGQRALAEGLTEK